MSSKPLPLLMLFLGAVFLSAACGPAPSAQETALVQPATAVVFPTATSQPLVISPPEPVATAVVTPLVVQLPTSSPVSDLDWRPPPYPVPLAIRPEDHFYFNRPVPSGDVNWPNPNYRYGSTLFGEMSIHTGVDLGAERNTPVLAAGSGEVVWVGYGLYRGVEDETDPYGLAIAIRHDFGYQGQPLYTVYAHMESITAWLGQHVESGELLGTVGDTGHAEGTHLHFEVRIGENRYFNTCNPELWLVPPEGWGVLAGRVMNTSGIPLSEQLVQLRSLETEQVWNVWTYAQDTTIHPDAFYQENFVISDLPAGPYEVRINFVGRTFTSNFFLYPGQTNVLYFEGRNGFSIHPSSTPEE